MDDDSEDSDPSEATDATILLVEDEAMVRRFVARVMQEKGYEVLTAQHQQEAMEICPEYPDSIELLLTDIVLPGGSGRELAFESLASRPQTRVLYISGYSDQRSPTAPDSTSGFLGKPFSAKELIQKVGEILGND